MTAGTQATAAAGGDEGSGAMSKTVVCTDCQSEFAWGGKRTPPLRCPSCRHKWNVARGLVHSRRAAANRESGATQSDDDAMTHRVYDAYLATQGIIVTAAAPDGKGEAEKVAAYQER